MDQAMSPAVTIRVDGLLKQSAMLARGEILAAEEVVVVSDVEEVVVSDEDEEEEEVVVSDVEGEVVFDEPGVIPKLEASSDASLLPMDCRVPKLVM